MGFADFYFQKYKIYNTSFPKQPVSPNLKQIIVIPSYREFTLLETIECLYNCEHQVETEVIVVFNAPKGEDPQILEIQTFQAKKVIEYNRKNLTFIPIIEHDLPQDLAGVGLARKLGMDTAIERFNRINNPDGIIISLDADTVCEKNYLQAVYDEFRKHPKAPGATISFEHPIEGERFPNYIYEAIALYELYMRYYVQALRYISFPYAFHTVGSAFAVRAWAYVKQGGMTVKQAGEDFYFLHKIIPLGNFFEIKSTKVYPSPRASTRVPFGTGPSVRQIITQKIFDYPTYPLETFLTLKPLFENAKKLFKQNWRDLNLHKYLVNFLEMNEFTRALDEMRRNAASEETFLKRFFAWFDAFKVLKYLNFCIRTWTEKKSVISESRKLLDMLSVRDGFSAKELLITYRKLQN